MLKRRHERTGRRAAPTGWKVPARWLLTASALSLFGCPDEELAPLEPCTVSGVSRDIPVSGVDKVDLLFVIDNSGSMIEEQAKLAVQLPSLVQILTSGMLPDGTTFQAVSDLHLGVVSSDMGASGVQITNVPTCTQDRGNGAAMGDDGVLISQSRDASCNFSTSGTRYLTYVPGMSAETPEQVAENFKCLASLGTTGCGFEQQLEAMYKALAPESVTFAKGSKGHGTGKNAGFLREDAVLAVIQVSDEEDCSIADGGAELFERNSNHPMVMLPNSTNRIGLNLRCAYREQSNATESRAEANGLIHSVDRYIDGLKALKPDNPDRVIFGAIVGIPESLENASFNDMLANEDMRFAPNPNDMGMGMLTSDLTGPKPACVKLDNSGNLVTSAAPAQRFVRTASGFGENGVIKSICADSYEGALTTIIEKISKQLTGACLPRPLSPNSEGVVECKVVEVLSRNATPQDCNAANGRVFLETRRVGDENRVVCEINQVPVQGTDTVPNPNPLPGVPADVGWYYDDFTPEVMEECPESSRQRISFRPESAKPSNSTVRIECFQPVARNEPTARGKNAVNVSCKDDARECDNRSDPQELVETGRGYRLTCEENTKTCQIVCANDVNCPTGWVCDFSGGPEQGLGFCVLPTCPPPATQ